MCASLFICVHIIKSPDASGCMISNVSRCFSCKKLLNCTIICTVSLHVQVECVILQAAYFFLSHNRSLSEGSFFSLSIIDEDISMVVDSRDISRYDCCP